MSRARAGVPAKAAEFFGNRAAYYDSRYDQADADGHALRSRMNAVLALVGDGPGAALDAGMGPGRVCAELDARGWTVSGVDAAAEMVKVAQTRLPSAAARFVEAPIEALPFAEASFDVVTATGVLEYSDVPLALRELARVLRPGARAVVSYPNPHAVYGIWKTRLWYPATRGAKRLLRRRDPQMPHGAGELPPEQFEAELARAGFTLSRVTHASYLPMLAPLDQLFPRTTARLGRRFEGSGGRRAILLATQVVYEARRTDESGAQRR